MRWQSVPYRVVWACCCLASLLAGCDKPPPTEYATPKAAATTFAKAVRAGDTAKAREASIGDETSAAVLDVLVETVGARRRLDAAARAKFGRPAGEILPVRTTGRQWDDRIRAAVETGREQINGDTAEVVGPGPGEVVRLKRVNGAWKVDRGNVAPDKLADRDAVKNMARTSDQAAAERETAAEIEAGKYATADEAREALRARTVAAVTKYPSVNEFQSRTAGLPATTLPAGP